MNFESGSKRDERRGFVEPLVNVDRRLHAEDAKYLN
jgi:hypothetical protein